jgi:hypothetical protein
MKSKRTMPKWVWWKKGECVVEVLKTGHFPTTIIGKLPSGKESVRDFDERLRPQWGTRHRRVLQRTLHRH